MKLNTLDLAAALKFAAPAISPDNYSSVYTGIRFKTNRQTCDIITADGVTLHKTALPLAEPSEPLDFICEPFKLETGKGSEGETEITVEGNKAVVRYCDGKGNERMLTVRLIEGNAYAQTVCNGRGEVVGLYPLLPSKVEVERDESGAIFYAYNGDKGAVKLYKRDVLHIPGLGFDGLVGYSPVAMAKNAIGTAIAVEEYGAKFFANGANPGGVLEFPGAIKDVQRVKESWNAGYQGAANAHRIAILEEGAKFHQVGIPPNEAQFLETRKFSTNEICRIFKVPPHLIADLEKATFSNIEHQSIDFLVHSINPWVVRWEQCLSQALILPSEQSDVFIKFNVDGLLRGDYKSRMEGYAIGRQNGWLSANDIRELENLNRIPVELGGDLYLTNGNMVPVSLAGHFAKNSENSEEGKENT